MENLFGNQTVLEAELHRISIFVVYAWSSRRMFAQGAFPTVYCILLICLYVLCSDVIPFKRGLGAISRAEIVFCIHFFTR